MANIRLLVVLIIRFFAILSLDQTAVKGWVDVLFEAHFGINSMRSLTFTSHDLSEAMSLFLSLLEISIQVHWPVTQALSPLLVPLVGVKKLPLRKEAKLNRWEKDCERVAHLQEVVSVRPSFLFGHVLERYYDADSRNECSHNHCARSHKVPAYSVPTLAPFGVPAYMEMYNRQAMLDKA